MLTLSHRAYVLIVLGALQALDATTTIAVIGVGGVEANPIMRNTAHGSPGWFLFWKVFAIVLVAIFAWWADPKKKADWFDPGLVWLSFTYVAIIGWNLYNLNAVI